MFDDGVSDTADPPISERTRGRGQRMLSSSSQDGGPGFVRPRDKLNGAWGMIIWVRISLPFAHGLFILFYFIFIDLFNIFRLHSFVISGPGIIFPAFWFVKCTAGSERLEPQCRNALGVIILHRISRTPRTPRTPSDSSS